MFGVVFYHFSNIDRPMVQLNANIWEYRKVHTMFFHNHVIQSCIKATLRRPKLKPTKVGALNPLIFYFFALLTYCLIAALVYIIW